MLVSDSEAVKRLNSPGNLINRLRKESTKNSSAMSVFGIGRFSVPGLENANSASPANLSLVPQAVLQSDIPSDVAITESNGSHPKLDSLIDKPENQIKLTIAHDTALQLLTDSVALLATKLDDVKADKLPSVIAAASKTVESIRRERNEAARNGKDQEVHYHFYTPTQRKVEDYTIVEVQ